MDYIYFDDYRLHAGTKLNPALLWEYNLADFDFNAMRNVVVQRVVERGWPDDFYAMLNLYGEKGTKEAMKAIPYLNDKDMKFASKLFLIPVSEMKCYEKKQSRPAHWNS